MKYIIDSKLMDKLILKNEITKSLKEKGYCFKLKQYESGELLTNMLEATQTLEFIVEGNLQIYAVKSNGQKCEVSSINKFTILGDVELYYPHMSPFLVEAKTKVLSLSLSIKEYKEDLMRDNEFLYFTSKSLAEKLILSAMMETLFTSLEEKFIHYIKEECEDQMITGVEDTACKLRCSRRQLQRVLRQLVEKNIIFKVKKGCYRYKQEV